MQFFQTYHNPILVHDLVSDTTEEDTKYAQSLGFGQLSDALNQSLSKSDLIFGVFDHDVCLAVAGIIQHEGSSQLWVHTAASVRGDYDFFYYAVPQLQWALLGLENLWVCYRADDKSIANLAKLAGFTLDTEEREINGVKHIVAWR